MTPMRIQGSPVDQHLRINWNRLHYRPYILGFWVCPAVNKKLFSSQNHIIYRKRRGKHLSRKIHSRNWHTVCGVHSVAFYGPHSLVISRHDLLLNFTTVLGIHVLMAGPWRGRERAVPVAVKLFLHNTLYCTVLCCTPCTVLCCAVLCCAVLCSIHCAMLCCAVLCCAVLCCAVLCCAVLYGMSHGRLLAYRDDVFWQSRY